MYKNYFFLLEGQLVVYLIFEHTVQPSLTKVCPISMLQHNIILSFGQDMYDMT